MPQINLTCQNPSESSPEFLQGMINRMDVSFLKYGAVRDAFPFKVNALDSLKQRLKAYQETGNTEYLMDAANFALIEWMCPSHEKAFFKATDSDGSTGRVWHSGPRKGERDKNLQD